MKNFRQTLKTISDIADGVINTVIKTEYTEMIAEERQKICMSCDDFDGEGAKCIVPGTQPCCGLCGCALSLKTRAMDTSCPAGKWGPVNKENNFNLT
jgi:hypothetical protein